MLRLNFFERLVLVLLLCFDMSSALAQKLPGDAAKLLPVLENEISIYWPDVTPRAFPAMIIDQESNWKSKATLKTSRELGCGLGQFTIAYDAKGNVRFDALTETKQLSSSLKNWDWRDCYNAQYQMRAVILKLKVNERFCRPLMRDNREIKACMGGGYNGGNGSVTKRIRMCRMEKGCQPDVWFDNLNRQCAMSNVKQAGYGESFCEINSKYPGRVEARQKKFMGVWPNDPILSEWPKK